MGLSILLASSRWQKNRTCSVVEKRERNCNSAEREKEEMRSGDYKLLREKAQTCTLYIDIGVREFTIVSWSLSDNQ